MATLPETPVLENGTGRIVPGRARNPAARMSAGAAQVQALQRHAIIGCPYHRPGAKQLIEAHFAVEDVSTDQAEATLKIERRMDLAPKD